MKMYPLMQYCDVTKKFKTANDRQLKIVILPYICKKSCDFDKIWCTSKKL